MMTEVLALATAIALVVSGMVEVVKKATNMPNRFLPLLAVVVGAAVGALMYFLDAELGIRIWAGAIAGLGSVGLFELGKNMKGE